MFLLCVLLIVLISIVIFFVIKFDMFLFGGFTSLINRIFNSDFVSAVSAAEVAFVVLLIIVAVLGIRYLSRLANRYKW